MQLKWATHPNSHRFLPQVCTLFGAQSLEMWAVGEAGAYRLHLPRLYGRVLPHKCRAKVNQVSRAAQCADLLLECGCCCLPAPSLCRCTTSRATA